MRKLIVAPVVLFALCAYHGWRWPGAGSPEGVRFSLLPGSATAPVEITRPLDHEQSGTYRYQFVREPSPVHTALRAVWIDELQGTVVAVGDEGVILERTVSGPWRVVPSPVRARLNAVSGGMAVGDSGTILVKGETGWRSELSGVSVPLHAITPAKPQAFAVGDRGVLLRRGATGRWTSVDTGTQETLRAVWYCWYCHEPAVVAVSESGSAIICPVSPDGAKCSPGPSPAADVPATEGERREMHLASIALMSLDGAIVELLLSSTPAEPDGRWLARHRAPWPAPAPARLFAATTGSCSWFLDEKRERMTNPEPIAVGEGGAAAFLTASGLVPFTLPSAGADLRAIDERGVDLFAVGDNGTVVHGTAPEAWELIIEL